MKPYRPPRQLLDDIKRLLATNQPSFHHSPLEDVIELLYGGRHYSWVGIYLTAGENTQQLLDSGGDTPAEVALPQTRSKILISMKLASRELGVLSVESERENAFGAEDRVLLEGVADVLARFLAGPGKYLARKARQVTFPSMPKPQARATQSSSAKPLRSAAAGDK